MSNKKEHAVTTKIQNENAKNVVFNISAADVGICSLLSRKNDNNFQRTITPPTEIGKTIVSKRFVFSIVLMKIPFSSHFFISFLLCSFVVLAVPNWLYHFLFFASSSACLSASIHLSKGMALFILFNLVFDSFSSSKAISNMEGLSCFEFCCANPTIFRFPFFDQILPKIQFLHPHQTKSLEFLLRIFQTHLAGSC